MRADSLHMRLLEMSRPLLQPKFFEQSGQAGKQLLLHATWTPQPRRLNWRSCQGLLSSMMPMMLLQCCTFQPMGTKHANPSRHL